MKDCSSLPVIAPQSLEPQKIIAKCGDWITLCGKGKHKISYYLGYLQGPVTVWFRRESLEDEIYVYQNGEIIAAAPLKTDSGSFTFDYSPLDEKRYNDEIILTHEGRTVGARAHIHLLCPVDPCLPPVVAEPSPVETTLICGKQWHQAGYMKKNTILLGDNPGRVDLIWQVVGNGLISVFQDKTLLFTMTPDREGQFSFEYDPDLGDVYLLTQGTGAVDYIFTCPYKEEVPVIPSYKFVCDSTEDYKFIAPQLTILELPVKIGTIDFRVQLVETAALTFSQNNVPFYVVSGHAGEVNFSYDYNPDKGKVTVNAEGYGEISLFAKCPYVAPDPIPVDLNAECGATLNTYAGYSNITMDMKGISGQTILDLIVTGTTLEIVHSGTSRFISESGSYPFAYDKSLPLIIKARGNDFQMRLSCPVRVPVTGTIDCGVIRNFDSLSNITVRYGSTAGNTTITTSQDVAVYRDNVLVGFGRDVTFFYPGNGVVLVKCDVLDEYLTISATCPSVKTLPCGDQLVQFNAGDIIDIAFATPLIRGHVDVSIQVVGNVSAVFRLGATDVHTSTATETFSNIWNTVSGLRVVSSGTGQFKLFVKCARPISIVDVETKTEQVNCQPGETAGGIPGANTYVTATWTVTTYSDGSKITSAKTYDGVCMPQTEVPIRAPRWGVAMFANRLFTGGPIASEITNEEQSYGVVTNPSPSGRDYTHWTGIQQFADQVMTNQFTMSATVPGVIETTITVDDFVYVMWDKRAAPAVNIINLGNNFEVEFEGILWRNDILGNYEGLPGYNPSLPRYLTVQYDDGTGVRDWVIIRQETTTLAEFSPRTDRYSIKYVP
jgi:hypothetical protein